MVEHWEQNIGEGWVAKKLATLPKPGIEFFPGLSTGPWPDAVSRNRPIPGRLGSNQCDQHRVFHFEEVMTKPLFGLHWPHRTFRNGKTRPGGGVMTAAACNGLPGILRRVLVIFPSRGPNTLCIFEIDQGAAVWAAPGSTSRVRAGMRRLDVLGSVFAKVS